PTARRSSTSAAPTNHNVANNTILLTGTVLTVVAGFCATGVMEKLTSGSDACVLAAAWACVAGATGPDAFSVEMFLPGEIAPAATGVAAAVCIHGAVGSSGICHAGSNTTR